MRILIDECLNWRLARGLPGHDVSSVQQMGWSGPQNGTLPTLAIESEFEMFVTGDRNLAFQQNTTDYRIAIVVLESGGTQLQQTLPLMSKVLEMIPDVQPGIVVRIRPD